MAPSSETPGKPAPTARLLCDVRALAGAGDAAGTAESGGLRAGAVWRLAEPARQLDANLVHLPPDDRVQTHAEPDLDVLLLVVAGHGVLDAGDRAEHLTEGGLFWLPRGSTRGLTAGADGLSYLTVHRRRPGLRITRRPRADTAP